jgi:glucosamine-6-phosphate deaminase
MLAPTPIQTFLADRLTVNIYSSELELANHTALLTQKYLQDILQHQETASLLLATGNTQIKFLAALVNLGEINWSRIILFHLDEYLGISPNSPASFQYYLRQRVENLVEPSKFYYIQGDVLEPIKECERYSQLLATHAIDLCFLGIGANGHLAFNEPQVANFQDPHRVKLVKLDDKNRQQQLSQGHFPTLESVPQYAFTLTLPTICSAKKIFCLATGKHKAQIVKQMLTNPIAPQCPASILREQDRAVLCLDSEAALYL